MYTEKQKNCWRYFTYCLFWIIIVCIGFCLIFSARGGSGGGSGTGSSAIHGDGPGKGKGDSGDSTGKKGIGNQADGAENAPAGNKPPGAPAAAKPPEKAQPKQPAQARSAVKSPAPQQKAPLSIVDKNSASEDTATIFLPEKKAVASSTEGGGSGSSSGAKAGFFGIQIDGSAIFLLDTSGSMSTFTKDGNMSRLELVKKEFFNMLDGKFKDSLRRRSRDHFRVVCFSSSHKITPREDKPGYRFSNVQEVASAIDFVKKLSPGGGTSMLHAWRVIIPIIRREEINSVYFLSDGEPNDCSGEELLRFLKQNAHGLKINTISMGQQSRLLKQIAAQHKGIYREVY